MRPADDSDVMRDAGPPPGRPDRDVAAIGAARPERTDRVERQAAERQRDAAEASRDRFSFLAETSRYLTESLDYETTLTTVAGMALPYLDAWCIVDVVTADGAGLRRVAVLHPDPDKQAAARELHLKYPPRADDFIGAPRVIRSGRSEMVFDVPDETLRAQARDPEHLALLRTLGVGAYVIAPMIARGRILGAITFVTADAGRRFGDVDILLAEDLARRAALAVDNANLYRDALAARDDAESALAEAEALAADLELARDEVEAAERATALRSTRLQALSAALSVAATQPEVAEAVVRHAADVFGASGIVVARLVAGGRELELMSAGAMPDEAREKWRRFPVDAPAPLAEVARTGEPLFLESREDWARRYPETASLLDAAGHHANAVLPLVVEGHVLGVLGAAFDAPRAFSANDRALAMAVAQQCAQALERARLFEAERAARAEAEAANRAKGEFLAAMSHELRTPLNAIGGYAQLLEMGIHGSLTDAQRDAIHRIEHSQRYLLRLINDVLNFERVKQGGVEYDLRPVSLDDVVAELEPLIRPQLQAKSLAYTVGPVHAVVVADHDKLVQILLNLLSNAVKFTPAGGRVTIECVNRGDGSADPGLVFLRVADTGIGIPRDKLDAVFEPFVQVDTTRAGRVSGAGLGLAISRDLARGMGGDIRVRSAVGHGTTFTLSLPRAEPARARAS